MHHNAPICARVGLEGENVMSSGVQFVTFVSQNANGQSEFADNADEAANFSTYFTANPPASSTPHLYVSALATWSTGTTLSQRWREQFPHIPSFIHRKVSDVPLMVIQTGSRNKSVALSADGTRIISGSNDNSVRVWDASTGAELKVLNGHTDYVNSVAFSADGTRIFSCSDDKSVRVWDASTGAELKVLNGHTDWVNSVAFSADGTRIISGSEDKSVRVWDASTGAEPVVPIVNTHSVNSITSACNSTCIALDSEEYAQLSMVGRAYPPWTNNTQTGWIHSVPGGYRLMWVPEAADPYTIIIISRKGSACINFQDCKIGREWAGCYLPS